MSERTDSPSGPGLHFPETSWGRIKPTDGPSTEADSEALEALARRYWRPIHAFLRVALSRGDEEALELTQDFFVWMIETGFVRKADASRGRFRVFLKAALRNYVADADRRERASKRGGGRRFVPLEGEDKPVELLNAISSSRTPESILDSRWRGEIISLALGLLDEELERTGQGVVYRIFQDYFLTPEPEIDYREISQRYHITIANVSNHLARAKERFRAHVKALLLESVRGPGDLEEELQWLLSGQDP